MRLEDNLPPLPPQNLDAESSVLGAILFDPSCLNHVREVLTAEDFYRPSHGTIFRVMVELFERAEPIDLLMLSEYLNSKNALEASGGTAYLASLSDFIPTAVNVLWHARIVKQKSVLRRVISLCTEAATRGYEEADP